MELEHDRAAAPPDDEDDRDVAKERAPVVCRVDNSDIELLILERSAHGQDIARPLGKLLKKRLAPPTLPPRVRHDTAIEGAECTD